MIRAKIIAVMCIWIIFSFVTAAGSDTGQIKVKATNPLSESRVNETICVDLKASPDLSRFSTDHKPSVYSEYLKQFILCQTIDDDGDGKNDELIFQADFEPGQSQVFRITDSNRAEDVNAAYRTNAMFVPQRKDDFAWENDEIAFRMYGQELQRTELTSSGIDVWVKKVKYPVMLNLYAKGHDYLHSDNPEGIDFFNIGPTLGCGGLGVWFDGKLYRSENYEQWKIIANGPIRAIFELTYKPWQFGNKKVGEIKRISLDIGSNFNRIESRFDADVNDVTFAVGIVKCERGGHPTYAKDKSWLGYWQNPDPTFGAIGCAVILPTKTAGYESAEDNNNNLILIKPKDSRSIAYYAGAGWSKTPDFDNEEKWLSYVQKKARLIEKPLKIEVLPK